MDSSSSRNPPAGALAVRPAAHPVRRFVRHYLEMVAAMVVGMVVLGGAVNLILAAVGHPNLLHYAGLRSFVMAVNMTVGMVLWMRYRHHTWPVVAEMAAAMFAPWVLLIGPFWAGLISGGALLGATHVLMLPAMLLAMLHRREEYTAGHGVVASTLDLG